MKLQTFKSYLLILTNICISSVYVNMYQNTAHVDLYTLRWTEYLHKNVALELWLLDLLATVYITHSSEIRLSLTIP